MGDGPYVHAFAITPAPLNATVLAQPTRGVWVGSISGGAVLQVIMNGDAQPVTIKSVVAGTIYPLSVTQVISTGTTASSIFGLW